MLKHSTFNNFLESKMKNDYSRRYQGKQTTEKWNRISHTDKVPYKLVWESADRRTLSLVLILFFHANSLIIIMQSIISFMQSLIHFCHTHDCDFC